MAATTFGDIRPGELSYEAAATLSRALRLLERLSDISGADPICVSSDAAGVRISLDSSDPGGTGGGRWIRFRLANTLNSTDASQNNCPVDYSWGGTSPGATVTVWNPPASVNYMFSGTTGKVGLATYDATGNKWWIIQMEC